MHHPQTQNSTLTPLKPQTLNLKSMNVFDSFKKRAWELIKRKAVEVLVAMLTAAITALTTTSCLGHGPF